MLLILAIPAALTYTYGRMSGDQKQGWTIFTAIAVLFLAGITTAYWAESHPNTALAGLGLDQAIGNMEGKEVRFGVASSAPTAQDPLRIAPSRGRPSGKWTTRCGRAMPTPAARSAATIRMRSSCMTRNCVSKSSMWTMSV